MGKGSRIEGERKKGNGKMGNRNAIGKKGNGKLGNLPVVVDQWHICGRDI